MRTTTLSILSGCIILVIMFSGCGKKPEMIRFAPRTVVFFGDSITFGYGVDTQTESFYALISKIMKAGLYGDVKTVNAGVSGDDTSEALERISTDVITHNPDIVVIAFGLNDCQNNSMTTRKFRENTNAMIAALPSKTEVILATSNTFLDTGRSLWKDLNGSLEPYMEEVRNIAREKGIRLIDVNDAWKEHLTKDQRHMETLYFDPTHPSAKGHRIIYETYMDVLRRVLMK